MTGKRNKSDRVEEVGYDPKKAMEIFSRRLADETSGRRANSQTKRDADLILKLLGEGDVPGARMATFSGTFSELFGITKERASNRCRSALKFLIEQGRVHPSDDKHPVYSLIKAE